MQTLVLALLLGAVLTFFSDSWKDALRHGLVRYPAGVFAAPAVLTAAFCASAALAGAASLPLAFAMAAYTTAPALCVYRAGPGPAKHPGAGDFAAILLLWLPLEFALGAHLVPLPAQGFLHAAAYGVAILLALVLFAGFRDFPGLKFNLPRGARDYAWPAIGLAAVAPVLAVTGIAIGFIPWPHAPAHPDPGWMAGRFLLIFAATGLPEEILFRSLIQNLLMLRFGARTSVLLFAAVLFGCAHLNNGPQPLPNWRYAILASIAGFAYGKVFDAAGTVLSSAALHAAVDAIKHFFF